MSGVGSTEPPESGGAGFAGSGAGNALVGVIMGSRSDWETMRHACETLEALEVPFEQQVSRRTERPTSSSSTRAPRRNAASRC